jgi:hypothetical protein
MGTPINSFLRASATRIACLNHFRRIHPQGVGRRVPRCCAATLTLAASRARSLLCAAVVASATGTARPTPCGCVYLSDMPRRSLIELLAIRLSLQAGKSLVMRGSLRCPRDTVGRSRPVRERGAAGLPAPNASHRRVRPAIPKNKFLEVPQ